MDSLKILQRHNILTNATSYILTGKEKRELISAFQNLKKAKMTSDKTLSYYKRMCGDYNTLDPEEIPDALKNDKIPYKDPIDLNPLDPENTIFINDRCYNLENMKEWASVFKDQKVKPSTPDTRKNLTLKDIRNLGLDPNEFIYTYNQDLEVKSNNVGKTELMVASQINDLDKVKSLVESGVDINDSDELGFTALMFAVIDGNFDIANYLLNNNANPNVKNYYQETPLIIAVKNNDLKTVDLLIRKGADLNFKNYFGEKPVDIARNRNYKEIVDYLKNI